MGFSGKWIELKATMFHDIIEIVKNKHQGVSDVRSRLRLYLHTGHGQGSETIWEGRGAGIRGQPGGYTTMPHISENARTNPLFRMRI